MLTQLLLVLRGAGVSRIWVFVLVLLSSLVCVSAIPPTDLPETSYNEIDTPVNLAPPAVHGVRIVSPEIATVILPREVREARRGVTAQANEGESAEAPVRRDPHSLPNLLCTFLI